MLPHHSAHEIPSHPRALSRAIQKALLNMALAALSMQHAFAQDSGTAAPAEEAVLPAVTATAQRTTTTEGSQSYGARAASSSTGLTLAPRDTPQSVTVITRQQLDDQNIQNVDQLLSATPGVTTTQLDVGTRVTFRARGFDVTTYRVDDIESNAQTSFSGTGSTLDLNLYDHVEVVRGANGLLGGTGDPSATVNLVRKKPTKERKISAGVSYGSWNTKRFNVDANLPVTEDGRVRSRFVISTANAGSFRERESINSLGFLGSIEADLTPDTTLNVGVQHEKNRHNGASWGPSVPVWYADGSTTNLSRSFHPVANWSYTDVESTTVFANLEHRLANRWKAKLALSHSESDSINNLGVVKANYNSTTGIYSGLITQSGTGGILNGFHSEYESQMTGLSASVGGPFNLFGREHEFVIGANGTKSQLTQYTFSSASPANCSLAGTLRTSCMIRTGLSIPNVFSWDGNYADFVTFRTNARAETTTNNYGIYATSRFNLTDKLKTIVGARLSDYETYIDTYSVANVATRSAMQSKKVVTPYVGVVYDLNEKYSVYASYTDVFKPQSQRDTSGDVLKPVTGSSYEMGVKGELLDGALNVSAAIFQAKQNNVAVIDGNNVVPGTNGTQAYVASGSGVESRGIELAASGNLTKNWTGMIGYAYLEQDGLTNANRDPHNTVKVQTAYQFSGDLSKLTIGGGVSYESATVWGTNVVIPLAGGGTTTTPVRTSGVALANAMARYQINDKTTLTLNINNLFDKTYYRQYGFYNGLIYGEPRSITVGLRADF